MKKSFNILTSILSVLMLSSCGILYSSGDSQTFYDGIYNGGVGYVQAPTYVDEDLEEELTLNTPSPTLDIKVVYTYDPYWNYAPYLRRSLAYRYYYGFYPSWSFHWHSPSWRYWHDPWYSWNDPWYHYHPHYRPIVRPRPPHRPGIHKPSHKPNNRLWHENNRITHGPRKDGPIGSSRPDRPGQGGRVEKEGSGNRNNNSAMNGRNPINKKVDSSSSSRNNSSSYNRGSSSSESKRNSSSYRSSSSSERKSSSSSSYRGSSSSSSRGSYSGGRSSSYNGSSGRVRR